MGTVLEGGESGELNTAGGSVKQSAYRGEGPNI